MQGAIATTTGTIECGPYLLQSKRMRLCKQLELHDRYTFRGPNDTVLCVYCGKKDFHDRVMQMAARIDAAHAAADYPNVETQPGWDAEPEPESEV